MRENRNIWSFKHDKEMISAVYNLEDFAKKYQVEQIGEQIIKNMIIKYPKYRAIKGDGNCFYRAIAFLYLRESDLSNFHRLFVDIPMICTNYPIDIQNQSQFKETLFQAYQKFLKPLANIKSKSEKEIRIQQLFNQYWAFDTLMVAYFRSLNYRQIHTNQQKYSKFYEDKGLQLRKIALFYQQSQGVQLQSMADALKVKITIIFAGKQNIKPIQYNEHYQSDNYNLFFRPGHYDIIYSSKQVERKIQASNIHNKFAAQQKFSPLENKNQLQNLNDFNTKSSIRSDPRIGKSNISTTSIKKGLTNNKVQNSSLNFQGNTPQMTYADKKQNLKNFTACETQRIKNFDYFSDGSLRQNQKIQKISVKSQITQTDINVGRIMMQCTVILFLMYFGYRALC